MMERVGLTFVAEGKASFLRAAQEAATAQNRIGDTAKAAARDIGALGDKMARIKTPGDLGRSFRSAEADARRFADSLEEVANASRRVSTSRPSGGGGGGDFRFSGMRDIPGLATGADGAAMSIGRIAGAAGLAAAATGALGTAGKMAFDQLAEGAKKADVATAFRRQVQEAGGVTDQYLAALQAASKGTISEFDLMSGASRAMVMGVTKDQQQLAALVQFAAGRARVLGEDSGKLFNDLVTGIARGSPLILDNLGIVVKLEEVNRDYAKALGKTVEQLSATEKQQALLNSVLKVAQQDAAKTGDFVGESYDRVKAAATDAKDATMEWAAITFEPLVAGLADVATGVANVAKAQRDAALDSVEQEDRYTKAVEATIKALEKRGQIDEATNLRGILDAYGGEGAANLVREGGLDDTGLIERILATQIGALRAARNEGQQTSETLIAGFMRAAIEGEKIGTAVTRGLSGIGINLSKVFNQGGIIGQLTDPRRIATRELNAEQTKVRQDRGKRLMSDVEDSVGDIGKAKERARRTQSAMAEAARDGAERIAEIARQNGRRVADIDRDAAQRRVDIGQQYGRRLADLAADYAKEASKAQAQFIKEGLKEAARFLKEDAKEAARFAKEAAKDAQRFAKEEAREAQRFAKDEAAAEDDFRQESIRAWEDYQQRRQDIERDSAKSIREAIRNRDGRALRDAIQARQERLSEADDEYKRNETRRQQDFTRQKEDRRRAYEEEKRDREEAFREAERERREAYEDERRERQDAYNEAKQERQEAFSEEQSEREEAYRERLADAEDQYRDEMTRLEEHTARQKEELARSYAEQLSDAQRAHTEKMAAMQAQLDAELAAVNAAIAAQVAAYKAYYEWKVAMDRWLLQQYLGPQAATPSTPATPTPNSAAPREPVQPRRVGGLVGDGASALMGGRIGESAMMSPPARAATRNTSVYSAPQLNVNVVNPASNVDVEGAILRALRDYHEGQVEIYR